MSSRSYLSIGDVLTLLREEFPDVTISKIRFLESQGLVNPERSPSGYRKFFEHDVERLRWVLRQQREHFLPLKVIRDRLAEGDIDESSDLGPAAVSETGAEVEVEVRSEPEPARHGNGRVAEPAHAGVGAGPGTHGRHVAGAGTGGGVGAGGGAGGSDRRDDALTQADNDAMARILADASRRAALLPESARGATRADAGAAVPVASAAVAAVPPPSNANANAGAAASAPTTAGRQAATPPSDTRPPAASPSAGERRQGKGVDVVAEAVAAAAGGGDAAAKSGAGSGASAAKQTERRPAPAADATAEQSKPPRPPAGSSTTSMVTGASLTSEELCAASGLHEAELASLQGFGLIASVVVAGIPTYDEDALTVANLAAELRIFGIEPRHLRVYKNAVDREVGLIEQVIIPLLRQRNPESRQRAIESAEQLGTLGQTMRATLLRAALRQHLGG